MSSELGSPDNRPNLLTPPLRIVLSAEGRVIGFNSSASASLNIPVAALLGKPFGIHIHNDSLAVYANFIARIKALQYGEESAPIALRTASAAFRLRALQSDPGHSEARTFEIINHPLPSLSATGAQPTSETPPTPDVQETPEVQPIPLRDPEPTLITEQHPQPEQPSEPEATTQPEQTPAPVVTQALPTHAVIQAPEETPAENLLPIWLNTMAAAETKEEVIALTQAARALFPGHSGVLLLIEPGHLTLSDATHWGAPVVAAPTPIPLSACYALRFGQTLSSDELPSGITPAHILLSTGDTALDIPLIAGAQIHGVLTLRNAQPFTAAERSHAQILARSIAIALNRAV